MPECHSQVLARDDQPVKPIVVPFELLKSKHMAVQVMINGKGPYRLIFDTGVNRDHSLNNKIAKEAGLLKDTQRPLFTFFGNMGEVKVKELQVGDQKAKDVSAIVMDHPTVEAISKVFGPIDGIVGFPFFARFKMTLDYQAKTHVRAERLQATRRHEGHDGGVDDRRHGGRCSAKGPLSLGPVGHDRSQGRRR